MDSTMLAEREGECKIGKISRTCTGYEKDKEYQGENCDHNNRSVVNVPITLEQRLDEFEEHQIVEVIEDAGKVLETCCHSVLRDAQQISGANK